MLGSLALFYKYLASKAKMANLRLTRQLFAVELYLNTTSISADKTEHRSNKQVHEVESWWFDPQFEDMPELESDSDDDSGRQ